MRRAFDFKLNELLESGVRSGDFRLADTSIAALAIGGIVSWAYVWYRPNGRLPLPGARAPDFRSDPAMAGVAAYPPRARPGAANLSEDN